MLAHRELPENSGSRTFPVFYLVVHREMAGLPSSGGTNSARRKS